MTSIPEPNTPGPNAPGPGSGNRARPSSAARLDCRLASGQTWIRDEPLLEPPSYLRASAARACLCLLRPCGQEVFCWPEAALIHSGKAHLPHPSKNLTGRLQQ